MHRIIHHAREHISRAAHKSGHHLKRRRNRFLLGVMCLNILLGIQIWTNFTTLPRTYIGDTSIGGTSAKTIASQLDILVRQKRTFAIAGRLYQYSYEDLGIYVDTKQTIEDIWEPNRRSFPLNLMAFFQSIFLRRSIDPVLYFSDNYTAFVDKTIYDFSDGADIMYLDQSNKTIGYIDQTQRFTLDQFSLQTILTESFGKQTAGIEAPLIPVDNQRKQSVEQTNIKLSRVYETPLTLIVGTIDAHEFFTLTTQALKDSTVATVTADTNQVSITIDTQKLEPYLSPLFALLRGRVQTSPAIMTMIASHIQQSLVKRFDGVHTDSVGIALDGGPNTDGSLAQKYIEVDISQQKLYTFDSGALIKTYRVSTGKDYPTPIGTFTILNKAPIGFSNIYDVWMPWWMAFSYSNELHAYFGFHELPYTLADGNKIQRPRDFIGVPNTGGCVALDVGEAKEVYQFATVGTKVVIFQ